MSRFEQPSDKHSHETFGQSEKCPNFFNAIERPELKEILTDKTPWVYWTLEIYRDDIKGGGGLGMLASDTFEAAKETGIPSVFVTLFYTKEPAQTIKNFEENTKYTNITPEERGFIFVGNIDIQTIIKNKTIPTKLKIYKKQEGCAALVAITEDKIGALYEGENNSDHRLYQEVALGIGGFQAVELLGVKPSVNQLNEAPTVFSALARLDKRVQETKNFAEALEEIKDTAIYTNHTLVQAVEADFGLDQFERFVIPNLKSEEVKMWLREKFKDKNGYLKLSTLAIELSSKRNGVSLAHASEASNVYKDHDGNPVEFEGITNGISMKRWGDPNLLKYYHSRGVIDEFNLPTSESKTNIQNLDSKIIEKMKQEARLRARGVLEKRTNQYGQNISIPDSAKIFSWKRRIAGYKRPEMMFERPDELAEILETSDSYLVMTGRAHSKDKPMQSMLKQIFWTIDGNPILKKRVHFVENYDEVLARALAQGSDASLNTPRARDESGNRISTEACGTSWEKDILGNTILISTPDGGVADLEIRARERGRKFKPPFLEIDGETYSDEVDSLYAQMRNATKILDNQNEKYKFLKKQLASYLPIISGSRMIRQYLDFEFP